MKRRGFTIIELLIVILIITLLISILTPAFKKTQELLIEIQCMNNVRQLSIACIRYADDHDNRFPFPNWPWTSYWNNPFPGGGFLFAVCDKNCGFDHLKSPLNPKPPPNIYRLHTNCPEKVKTGQLWKYLRSLDVYRCPLDPVEDLDPDRMINMSPPSAPKRKLPEPETSRVLSSYNMNGGVIGYGNGGEGKNEWETCYIDEFNAGDIIIIPKSVALFDGCGNSLAPIEGGGKGVLTTRHRGGGIVGCVDGHAEWMSQEDFEAEASKPGRNRLYCYPRRSDGAQSGHVW